MVVVVLGNTSIATSLSSVSRREQKEGDISSHPRIVLYSIQYKLYSYTASFPYGARYA